MLERVLLSKQYVPGIMMQKSCRNAMLPTTDFISYFAGFLRPMRPCSVPANGLFLGGHNIPEATLPCHFAKGLKIMVGATGIEPLTSNE
jgi:hypothetical protein